VDGQRLHAVRTNIGICMYLYVYAFARAYANFVWFSFRSSLQQESPLRVLRCFGRLVCGIGYLSYFSGTCLRKRVFGGVHPRKVSTQLHCKTICESLATIFMSRPVAYPLCMHVLTKLSSAQGETSAGFSRGDMTPSNTSSI
jgi:hypothetical protein